MFGNAIAVLEGASWSVADEIDMTRAIAVLKAAGEIKRKDALDTLKVLEDEARVTHWYGEDIAQIRALIEALPEESEDMSLKDVLALIEALPEESEDMSLKDVLEKNTRAVENWPGWMKKAANIEALPETNEVTRKNNLVSTCEIVPESNEVKP